MKKTLLILLTLIIGINLNTQAEDFSAVYNGATIYYNITSSTSPYEVAVTYQGSSYNTYSDEYSGAVSIPDSVLYGGNYYKVTSIGNYTFNNCTGLTSITIPNSVTSIGYNAFRNTPYYNNMPDGVVYINNVLYKYKGTMPANTSINIQSGTVSISDGAFSNCSGLTSITIPNSVTSIGIVVFEDCTGLTSITIPNSVTSIGQRAFEDCTGLTSITIPNSVTSIDYGAFNNTPWYNNKPDGIVYINNVLYKYKGTMPANSTINIQAGTVSITGAAFYDCSSLISITIPNSLNSINGSTFFGCSGLTSITIPNSITSIGYYAFYGCTGLTSITIPNSITSIGDGAFVGCTGLTSITISNSITSIGDLTFNNCTGLISITIPRSVTSIGDNAFSFCGLTSITCAALIPPIIWGTTFSDVEQTIPLFVPIGTKSVYQTAPYWSMFSNIIEKEISVPASIFQEKECKLYPNPTNNKSKLEIEGLTTEVDILVYDMIGRVIQKHRLNKGTTELDIDLSGYAKGVYSIRIMNDNINQTKKLIVQ